MEEVIKKVVTVELTNKEVESPNPIVIELVVSDEDGESVTYTITYPKE